METLSLQALLEEDREMLMTSLGKDRSLQAAQTVLEKETDRLIYRCLEQYKDTKLRNAAQYILQTVKNTLPLIDAVGEARAWQKTLDLRGERRKKLRPAALGFLLAGILLVLATVLALHFGSDGFRLSLPLLRAFLPSLGGMACLFWAGVLTGRPEKAKQADDAPAVRMEYLVDVEKVWRLMRAAMVMADSTLAAIRDELAIERQNARPAQGGGALSAQEVELFSELLETAYAMQGEDAREMTGSIRFFLHGNQVEVVDFEKGKEAWFEFLPASGSGTLRPALASGGKLLKKGLASA